jgi:23S rRNA (uridine2552-2'-O)-methyltransferase
MAKRTKSSQRWLQEHERDVCVKRAREEGYRSRAVFKLEEIQRTDRSLRPGTTIVDLGAAPRGWSQYAAKLLRAKCRIIAVDILPMDEILGVEFIHGDSVRMQSLRSSPTSWGTQRSTWCSRTWRRTCPESLTSITIDLCIWLNWRWISPNSTWPPRGDFLTKLFQGRGFQPFMKQLRESFETVKVRKPPASRQRTRNFTCWRGTFIREARHSSR